METKARAKLLGLGKGVTYMDLREAIRAAAAQVVAELMADFPGCEHEVIEELWRAGSDATFEAGFQQAIRDAAEPPEAEQSDESDETWGADDDAD